MSRDRAVDNIFKYCEVSCELNNTWYRPKRRFCGGWRRCKPISTGSVGSGHVREYRAKIRDLRKRRAALKRTVLQETWIYKTWIKNLGNFDCQVGREVVPQTPISKLNHELLGDEPLENLDTWIEYFLYKHALSNTVMDQRKGNQQSCDWNLEYLIVKAEMVFLN